MLIFIYVPGLCISVLPFLLRYKDFMCQAYGSVGRLSLANPNDTVCPAACMDPWLFLFIIMYYLPQVCITYAVLYLRDAGFSVRFFVRCASFIFSCLLSLSLSAFLTQPHWILLPSLIL